MLIYYYLRVSKIKYYLAVYNIMFIWFFTSGTAINIIIDNFFRLILLEDNFSRFNFEPYYFFTLCMLCAIRSAILHFDIIRIAWIFYGYCIRMFSAILNIFSIQPNKILRTRQLKLKDPYHSILKIIVHYAFYIIYARLLIYKFLFAIRFQYVV